MDEREKEASAKEDADSFDRKIYGDYEILRPIGKGKFAVVYRAKRLTDGETVALKRISVDMMDEKAREKCLKEVRLLQSLDHPNIIRYLDSFIDDKDLIIIVEWAAAGDLKRQLRKAQEKGANFEERIIWKYFSQISAAMQHMHDRRIMHRDLKPANIFLTLDSTVKVGDLGLSRELSQDTMQAHSKVGTPLYMSPEVLRGDGYDFKSDIWSLGCLLYELAMLKSPFKAEGLNLYSLFQKISQGEFQPISDIYSEELRSLAYSMISTKSEDRPTLAHVCDVANRMRKKTTVERKKKDADVLAIEERTRNILESGGGSVSPPSDIVSRPRSGNERPSFSPREAAEMFVQTNEQMKHNMDLPPTRTKAGNPSATPQTHQQPQQPSKYYRTPSSEKDFAKGGGASRISQQQQAIIQSPQNLLDDGMYIAPDHGNAKGKISDNAPAFPLMEIFYVKLSMLGYFSETGNSLLPMHFACELSALFGTEKVTPVMSYYIRGGNQFEKLVQVTIWLCKKILPTVGIFAGIEHDPPITISKKLLLAAQNAGVPSAMLSEITPSALQSGSGEKVCTFLNALADVALVATKHSWQPVKYTGVEAADDDKNDALGDLDDDGVDDLAEVGEASDGSMGVLEEGVSTADYASECFMAGSLIVPTVDPNQWRQEMERVSVVLATSMARVKVSGNDWRDRVHTLSSFIGERRDNSPKEAVNLIEPFKSITGNIVSMKRELLLATESVSRVEKLINSRTNIDAFNREYSIEKQKLDSLSSSIAKLVASNEESSSTLSDLDAKIEESLLALHALTDGENGNQSSLVVSVKQAIKRVKDDIQGFDLAIALITHDLDQRRCNLFSRGLRKTKGRAKYSSGYSLRSVEATYYSDEDLVDL